MTEMPLEWEKKPLHLIHRKTNPVQKGNLRYLPESPGFRLLHLQKTLGNQAIQRMVRQGGVPSGFGPGHKEPVREREADRLADQMTATPAGTGHGCAPCRPAGDVAGMPVPASAAPPVPEGPGIPPAVTEVLRSPGRPLDASSRSHFESRLGVDLGPVRVHTGEKAAASAEAVHARAYTSGTSIVFGNGEYAPGTGTGRRLLAHELAHVLRQDSENALRRQKKDSAMTYTIQAGDTLTGIAKKFGISLAAIKKANPGIKPEKLSIGQKLNIPSPEKASERKEGTPARKTGEPGKKADSPQKTCDITVPGSTEVQLLAGAIYAEASPREESNEERHAIGWAFRNSVDHTTKICGGSICGDLKEHERAFQCKNDTRDLGSTLTDVVKTGSVAYNNSRWNRVMNGTVMLPAETLCTMEPSEQAALKKAIGAATSVMAGTGKKPGIIRFNKAANSPPNPERMEKAERIGSHTFYRFKKGLECGVWKKTGKEKGKK